MENLNGNQIRARCDARKVTAGADRDTGNVGAMSARNRRECTWHAGATGHLRRLTIGAITVDAIVTQRVAGFFNHFAREERMILVDARVHDHDHGAGAIQTRLQRQITFDLRDALCEERFGQAVFVDTFDIESGRFESRKSCCINFQSDIRHDRKFAPYYMAGAPQVVTYASLNRSDVRSLFSHRCARQFHFHTICA